MAMTDQPSEQEETRAISIVGKSLVEGVIAILASKKLLNPAETNQLFETVVGSVKKLPRPDPGADRAQFLLEAMAALYKAH
jgi:hypothetical protein